MLCLMTSMRTLKGLALCFAFAGRALAQEATPESTPPAETAPPPSPSSHLVQDALLVVTAREGSGSGFVARLNGEPLLITNAHVIAGASRLQFQRLSGTPVAPGKGRLAFGHDVATFIAPDALLSLEISQDVSKDAAIGDEVIVYGNSHGASVATELKGKIVGLGPELVEIDAPFVPGNSGSPILHVKSGKVIGIASYVKTRKHDELSKDSGVAEVRRFGYRLDTIKNWQDLNWPLFQREAAQIQAIEDFSDAYFQFWEDLNKNKGRISSLSSTNPRIQRHLRNLQRESANTRGEKQFQKAVTSFLWALQSEAKQEFLPGRPAPQYWFTKHEWNRQKELREKISKDLGSEVAERNTRTN
jgi:hypothetical protein